MENKLLVVDIETDSLNPSVVWVAVTKEYDTGEVRIWERPDISNTREFASYLAGFNLVGHNIIGFDLPVLSSLCSVNNKLRKTVDTLVLSRLSNSWDYNDHSLEAWGRRLGFPKGNFSDWSKLSQEMIDYCRQDVEVTYRILKKLEPWWSAKENWKSIRLEHDTAILCEELQKNGFKFDAEKARGLHKQITTRLSEMLEEIHRDFRPKPVPIRQISPRATKTGSISKTDFRWLEGKPEDYGYCIDAPFCLFEYVAFNPGSSKQRIEVLNSCGWQPKDKTKGHIAALRDGTYEQKKEHWETYGWKVNEENLGTLPKDAPEGARKLVQYITLDSRRSTLEEWLNAFNEDTGRIHGNFNHINPWTHRMSHSGPNMANIPSILHVENRLPTDVEKISLEFNPQYRELWCVSDDRLLIGTDADSIQLRVLAHYLGDEGYAAAVADGKKEDETDVHNVNKRALGLNSITRDISKTFIYAWLLGAGLGKVSEILSCSGGQAKESVERFIQRTPGLEKLKKEGIPYDAQRGYFVGLDGRMVRCTSEHLMLAGYLQAGEAVIMKWANRLWANRLRKEGIWFKQVNFVHDEWQTEVENDKEVAEYVGQIQAWSIRQAGEDLGVKCRLDGEYTIGKNWRETH